MSKVGCHNIIFRDGNIFLIEDFLLALDKRHIMLDYYHVQTVSNMLFVEEIRRKRADT
jgi:hypothetical protein